jgi:hypothetical protein
VRSQCVHKKVPGGSESQNFCYDEQNRLVWAGNSGTQPGAGNVTSRTYSSTTATLTYDLLDHFVNWNAGSTNKDLYVYDASGNRVLRRTTSSSGTSMTVYAFGLEEHSHTSTGGHGSDLYYYSLAGCWALWTATETPSLRSPIRLVA